MNLNKILLRRVGYDYEAELVPVESYIRYEPRKVVRFGGQDPNNAYTWSGGYNDNTIIGGVRGHFGELHCEIELEDGFDMGKHNRNYWER